MGHKPAWNDWLALILLSCIWGSSYILMKKGLESFSPSQVASLRIAITGIILLPFGWIRRNEIPPGKTKYILLQGLFGNFIPAFLFTAAQHHIESSLAGILNSLSPVFVFILGIFFFGSTYKWQNLLGLAVAFSAILLLMAFQPAKNAGDNNQFGLLVVVATFSYGISSNIIKKFLHDVRPLTIASFAFMMMLIPSLVLLYFTCVPDVLEKDNGAVFSLGYILILAVGGTAIAAVMYNKLIHRTTALFAASVTYLMPIVALFWGFLAGESISAIDFIGMAMIFAGVYLVSR